jgi:succinate dehydrogenase hydrophobic anchor subunit
MNKDFKQTSRSGSVAWLLQRISAVILFVLLLLHFVTYHLLGQGGRLPCASRSAAGGSPR